VAEKATHTRGKKMIIKVDFNTKTVVEERAVVVEKGSVQEAIASINQILEDMRKMSQESWVEKNSEIQE
jgi:hypothetical protein